MKKLWKKMDKSQESDGLQVDGAKKKIKISKPSLKGLSRKKVIILAVIFALVVVAIIISIVFIQSNNQEKDSAETNSGQRTQQSVKDSLRGVAMIVSNDPSGNTLLLSSTDAFSREVESLYGKERADGVRTAWKVYIDSVPKLDQAIRANDTSALEKVNRELDFYFVDKLSEELYTANEAILYRDTNSTLTQYVELTDQLIRAQQSGDKEAVDQLISQGGDLVEIFTQRIQPKQ